MATKAEIIINAILLTIAAPLFAFLVWLCVIYQPSSMAIWQ